MGKRKLHEFIDNVEHKHCGKCNQWKLLDQFGKDEGKWDEKRYYCKVCSRKKQKQRDKQRRKVILEKRHKAREEASVGFSVCLSSRCTVKNLMQSVNQFINPYVHTHTLTNYCLTCRAIKKKLRNISGTSRELCKKVYDDWRQTHACVRCMNDPNYKHNYLVIEADHLPEFKKVKQCSAVGYWSHTSRGVHALKEELKKCQPLCRFHHQLQTQQRNHDNGRIQKQKRVLKKRAVINAEKHKRGCCSNPKCKRVLKKGEECGFSFDHRDPTTKFIHNGKAYGPSSFVHLSQALFDIQWPLEKELVDLLCRNCHKLKTFECKDGYRK